MKSRQELNTLATKYGWTPKKPGQLTLSAIHVMLEDEYAYHLQFSAQAVEYAINPPPVPVPVIPEAPLPALLAAGGDGPAARLHAQKTADTVREFQDWCAKEGIKVPGPLDPARDVVMESFIESKKRAAEIAERARQTKIWLKRHPEFIPSESNRNTLCNYLLEHGMDITAGNLETAFKETAGDLVLRDAAGSNWQAGTWRNGQFIPHDGSGVPKSGVMSRRNADPAKTADGEPTIRKRASNMSADEFVQALASANFRERMDKSAL
jgi:hypothetical protein